MSVPDRVLQITAKVTHRVLILILFYSFLHLSLQHFMWIKVGMNPSSFKLPLNMFTLLLCMLVVT